MAKVSTEPRIKKVITVTRAIARTSLPRPKARASDTILDTATGKPAEEITYMAV